jgi:chitinase
MAEIVFNAESIAGATRTAFSDMSSSSTNRQAFIQGLMKFMDTYGFDGVDLDWEYPAADDRGGVAADRANYVSLLKDMRTAFGTSYGLTVTLPTSYWYLQHFDLEGMADEVDWFNLMSYDLHGESRYFYSHFFFYDIYMF